MKKILKSPVGMVGLFLTSLALICAIFAPVLSPHPPQQQNITQRLVPPAWHPDGTSEHILGTDYMGRDVLSRIIYGSRTSITVGITAVILAGAIGLALGLLSGYKGGVWDSVIMRFVDAFMAIPSILLIMLLVGVLRPGVVSIIIILGVTRWITYARVVRAEVLQVREMDYVTAIVSLGQKPWKILLKHIFPNISASFMVVATLNVANVIIAESSLSFLGIGVPHHVITWGSMLAIGREYISVAWWIATFPGVAITLTVLGIIFLGDFLRDTFDPRLRG